MAFIKWLYVVSLEPLNVGAEWPEVTVQNTRSDIFDALVTHPTLGVMCPEVTEFQPFVAQPPEAPKSPIGRANRWFELLVPSPLYLVVWALFWLAMGGILARALKI